MDGRTCSRPSVRDYGNPNADTAAHYTVQLDDMGLDCAVLQTSLPFRHSMTSSHSLAYQLVRYAALAVSACMLDACYIAVSSALPSCTFPHMKELLH
jgi:hypothetical protein